MRTLSLLGPALVALVLAACAGGPGEWGASCASSDDCADVFVCRTEQGSSYCTRRCDPERASSGCPEGWTCAERPGETGRGLCVQPR